MKKLSVILIALLVFTSCSSTREGKSSKSELRSQRRQVDQLTVKNAVENRRYIIKLNRLYFNMGGIAELIPRANFIIIDGEKAVISTAYLGRQYDIKPIVGINMRGRAEEYSLTNNLAKGSYKIKLKVSNGQSNSFDLYIDISKGGYCTASISSLKIDNIRYSGYLQPIAGSNKAAAEQGDLI
jgi:hypothetical protein